jgi:hypothetical protein
MALSGPAPAGPIGRSVEPVSRHRFHQVRAAAMGLLLGGLLTVLSVAVVFADGTGPPWPR